jgi:hypothetical protein
MEASAREMPVGAKSEFEVAVWGLLVHAVRALIAPKVALPAWVALRESGRAFVVARLQAAGVTVASLAARDSDARVVFELRRVAAAARMWMARFDRVAPALVKLVAARMLDVGALTEADARSVTDHCAPVALVMDDAGCTNEGLFALLVSVPVDGRIEPLAYAFRAACPAASNPAHAMKRRSPLLACFPTRW